MASLPTISMVEASDPHSLTEAAKGLHAKATDPFALVDKLGAVAQEAAHHLKGDGEEARLVTAMGEHLAARGQLEQFEAMAMNLDQWGSWLVSQKDIVRRVVAEAKEAGFAVHDNGDVEGPADKTAQLDQHAKEIHEALQAYGDGEENAANGLRRMLAQLTVLGEGASGKIDLEETDQQAAQRAQYVAQLLNRGNLSADEARLVAEELAAHGLTQAQVDDKLAGRDVQLTKEQSAFVKAFAQTADARKLLEAKDGHYPWEQAGGRGMAEMMLTATSPKTVFADKSRGGRDVANKTWAVPGKLAMENMTQMSAMATLLDTARPEAMQGSQLNQDLAAQVSKYAACAGNPVYDGYQLDPREISQMQHILQVSGRDHTSMTNLLTGDLNGDGHPDPKKAEEVMRPLMTMKWPDQGKSLASMVGWIGDDAHGGQASPQDQYRATQAGHAAYALAGLVSNVDDGKGDDITDNLYKKMLDNPNPLFTRAIADAETPYLGAISGVPASVHDDTMGFCPKDQGDHNQTLATYGSEQAVATRLFSVIDSDDKAAGVFNARAELAAQSLEGEYARSAAAHHDGAGGKADTAAVDAAERLQGLVEAGAQVEAHHHFQNQQDAGKKEQERWKTALDTSEKVVEKVADQAGVYGKAFNQVEKNLAPFINDAILDALKEDKTHAPTANYDPTQMHSGGARAYDMAAALHRSGVALPPEIAEAILDQNGNLKPYDPHDQKIVGAESDIGSFLSDHGVTRDSGYSEYTATVHNAEKRGYDYTRPDGR